MSNDVMESATDNCHAPPDTRSDLDAVLGDSKRLMPQAKMKLGSRSLSYKTLLRQRALKKAKDEATSFI